MKGSEGDTLTLAWSCARLADDVHHHDHALHPWSSSADFMTASAPGTRGPLVGARGIADAADEADEEVPSLPTPMVSSRPRALATSSLMASWKMALAGMAPTDSMLKMKWSRMRSTVTRSVHWVGRMHSRQAVHSRGRATYAERCDPAAEGRGERIEKDREPVMRLLVTWR